MFKRRRELIIVPAVFLTCCLQWNCGSKPPAKGNGGPHSPVEQAFRELSNKAGIPPRMTMAVAYLESRMNPKQGFALYPNGQKAPRVAQTAFGISRTELGIQNRKDGDNFITQIDAYTKWLGKRFESLGLPKDPQNAEEKFSWIWALAQQQRQGKTTERNLQTLFAKEVLDILNNGFTWQDGQSNTPIKFDKESPSLQVSDFRDVSQNLLKLSTRPAQVYSADLVPIFLRDNVNPDFIPTGIEIIHCPFNLSACLQMQSEDPANLVIQAHYVIPPDNKVTERPLQLAFHEVPLKTLLPDGTLGTQNKVTIMLTGPSGKVVNGSRTDVNPLWVTKWQLQRMGELVSDICSKLVYDHKDTLPFKADDCGKVGKTVTFRSAADDNVYRWGDIDDFDFNIFSAYVASPTGLGGETAFAFSDTDQIYDAGAPVKIQVAFQLTARELVLEKLVRCPNKQTVWSVFAKEDIRSQTKFQMEKSFWDAGPNNSGEQFIRAKVFEKNGALLGWTTNHLYLKHFEPAQIPFDVSECGPNS